jgi:hypothetical protein
MRIEPANDGKSSAFNARVIRDTCIDESPAMKSFNDTPQRQNLREQVEQLLPTWQSWYPSLFHAAEDLGLIRARVCAPSSLMLSNRHAAVQSEALQAFKEQWSVEEEPELPEPARLAVKATKGLAAKVTRGQAPQIRRTPRPNYSGLPQPPPRKPR